MNFEKKSDFTHLELIPRIGKEKENWKRVLAFPVGNQANTVIEFVQNDDLIYLFQIQEYEIITRDEANQYSDKIQEIAGKYGKAYLSTHECITMTLEEFAYLYKQSQGFVTNTIVESKPGSDETLERKIYLEKMDFAGINLSKFTLVKATPDMTQWSTEQHILIKTESLLNAIKPYRYVFDGAVALILEKDPYEGHMAIFQIACWIARYYVETLSQSRMKITATNGHECFFNQLILLADEMYNDFDSLMKIFRPDHTHLISFSEILITVIYPYLEKGIDYLLQHNFSIQYKPLIYNYLNHSHTHRGDHTVSSPINTAV